MRLGAKDSEAAEFSKMSPVGLVSIAIFEKDKRPHRNPHNVAMVYAVGPDSGGRVGVARTGKDSMFQLREFLYATMLVSRAVMSATVQYNQTVARNNENKADLQDLPDIPSIRMCLLSGGSYRHPDAT